MSTVSRRLVGLFEELPYHPPDLYTPRWPEFVIRGGLIVLVCGVAFLPALVGDVLWADESQVTANELLRSGSGLARLWREPTAQHSYRPLADTLLWVEHRVWRALPTGYHLVSLLLHTANVLLAWAVLRRLEVRGAWLAALAFALHP